MINNSLLNFIFFPVCAGCAKPGEPICPQCLDALEAAQLKCHKCDRKNPYGIYCVKCSNKYTPGRVLALYHFSGTIKELIHSFKYEDEKELAVIFAQKLTNHICKTQYSGFTLVPIPISSKRKRFRGYNQSELLALEISKLTELNFCDILQKSDKHSQVQAGTRDERKSNVRGTFFIKDKAKIPTKILLIDDVVTTGATVEEATKVLKKAGAKEVIVLALAMG